MGLGKTLNYAIKEHFMQNIAIYGIIIIAFIIGICAGAFTVNLLNYSQYRELHAYIETFFDVMHGQEINHGQLFKISVLNNVKIMMLLTVLSFTVIGIPFVLIIIGVRGFVLGFTVGFFVKMLNMKGMFLSILSILPQNLIFIPCYIVLGFLCISFSLSHVRKKNKPKNRKADIKIQLLTYSIMMVFMFLLLTVGSIIEAYITPVFIKLLV